MSFTRAWKTAGVLARPKGITKYSEWPRGVLNAVFHSSTSQIRTRWSFVKFCEDGGCLKGLKQGDNQGQCVLVLHRDAVEGPACT